MLRRTLTAIGATVLLLAAFAGQALAHPPPTHLHCLTTPNGNVHSIARGATYMSNHDTAFHNFHENVHHGAFHDHPLGPLQGDPTLPYTCPPS